MSATINDRPIETVRSETIDRLIMNYSHGELSYAAFERRLDQAMAADSGERLVQLVVDLPLEVDKDYQTQKQQTLGANCIDAQTEEQDSMINVLSGNSRTGQWKVPRTFNVYSVLSGSTIDLTDALFTCDTVTIKLHSFLSGDKIYLPENVNLVCKTVCILGSVENKATTFRNPDAPTVIIEGLTLLGSIELKIRTSLKERFVAFADGLKKLLS